MRTLPIEEGVWALRSSVQWQYSLDSEEECFWWMSARCGFHDLFPLLQVAADWKWTLACEASFFEQGGDRGESLKRRNGIKVFHLIRIREQRPGTRKGDKYLLKAYKPGQLDPNATQCNEVHIKPLKECEPWSLEENRMGHGVCQWFPMITNYCLVHWKRVASFLQSIASLVGRCVCCACDIGAEKKVHIKN